MPSHGIKILPYGNDENVNAERLDRDIRLLADKINGGLTVDNLSPSFRITGGRHYTDYSVTIPFEHNAATVSFATQGLGLFVAPSDVYITGISLILNDVVIASLNSVYITLTSSPTSGEWFNAAMATPIQLTKLSTTNETVPANMNFAIFYANTLKLWASGTRCFAFFGPNGVSLANPSGSVTVSLRSLDIA